MTEPGFTFFERRTKIDNRDMKLSHARADTVVTTPTTKYKVNPQSMKTYGVGQLAAIAPNKTEVGRAKNRRVESVER
jgi:outer membrane protein OmpA-like peptidoglycan-associated protein